MAWEAPVSALGPKKLPPRSVLTLGHRAPQLGPLLHLATIAHWSGCELNTQGLAPDPSILRRALFPELLSKSLDLKCSDNIAVPQLRSRALNS